MIFALHLPVKLTEMTHISLSMQTHANSPGDVAHSILAQLCGHGELTGESCFRGAKGIECVPSVALSRG